MKYSRHLVDRRRVHVVGGRGGSGGMLYTKHKKHNMLGPGWPCGGAGGRGGDVVVEASGGYHSLANVQGHVQAEPGMDGRKRNINGTVGRSATIHVPRGVTVRELLRHVDEEAGGGDGVRTFRHGRILGELNEAGESVVVAAGGRGGHGNTLNRPHKADDGKAGEERFVELELKMVADVGLVGMPNAGKSTLLGAMSRACPKIAPYPFTTVAPYVGRAEFVDGSAFTVADVPGLVEGAHRGEGLGHEFLRHLQRTQVLLYVVDASRSRDPFADLLGLQREVAQFSLEMATKPCGVVANKCDLDPHASLQKADRLFNAIRGCDAAFGDNLPLFVRATSARFGEGVKGLLQEVRRVISGDHPGWQARVAARREEEAW